MQLPKLSLASFEVEKVTLASHLLICIVFPTSELGAYPPSLLPPLSQPFSATEAPLRIMESKNPVIKLELDRPRNRIVRTSFSCA
jgi:hypothetical protein